MSNLRSVYARPRFSFLTNTAELSMTQPWYAASFNLQVASIMVGITCLSEIKKASESQMIRGFNILGAQSESRTRTPVKALDPEPSVSTNSTTWAAKKRAKVNGHQTFVNEV